MWLVSGLDDIPSPSLAPRLLHVRVENTGFSRLKVWCEGGGVTLLVDLVKGCQLFLLWPKKNLEVRLLSALLGMHS